MSHRAPHPEHKQQPPASSFTLPQHQNTQTGTQTQSATSLKDQPQGVQVQYQPSGNDLTSLAGEGSNSTAIVDAELTHLISRDDDTEMPAALLVHDTATPRRQVGARCPKWAVSTQQTTDKRKCAACCMCGQQSIHGESRFAYVDAQCVNGVAHDHELHRK